MRVHLLVAQVQARDLAVISIDCVRRARRPPSVVNHPDLPGDHFTFFRTMIEQNPVKQAWCGLQVTGSGQRGGEKCGRDTHVRTGHAVPEGHAAPRMRLPGAGGVVCLVGPRRSFAR